MACVLPRGSHWWPVRTPGETCPLDHLLTLPHRLAQTFRLPHLRKGDSKGGKWVWVEMDPPTRTVTKGAGKKGSKGGTKSGKGKGNLDGEMAEGQSLKDPCWGSLLTAFYSSTAYCRLFTCSDPHPPENAFSPSGFGWFWRVDDLASHIFHILQQGH